ncbi:hypothetical protein VF14_30435 [Nostoc linckia z18]|uniref:Uncharacterized protein n=2 Tax=Nostoc linckia TaxID=92942 RepID=A0A9Q6EIH6_NOSLI|nr:hypothetical protein [Nostoc linckia]PHK31257.1 hypothetical protein VF12_28385 [Nostoc linckia z15]PHK43067.1 hypothetical protein VF13_28615 [Nostoc linckia z16]PHJ57306.1 hypothetical protein VF02_30695 [Nostoc linckia z1]PHJ57823.1 hypothetical protein VF05_35120 [Nostoc linckia z3]PHJ64276.1 hypothetical protein VF03_29390 [Nostoc linckia z2]
MNIQLVESLASAIKALSAEVRELLNQKLTHQSNWQKLRPRILANAQAIQERLNGQILEPDIDEIIHQIREERDQQFMVDLFPIEEKS